MSFPFSVETGHIELAPDRSPVFIASLISSAGIRCGPPSEIDLLPSARIRCQTEELSFGEPNEDEDHNKIQRWFHTLPPDETLEIGVIPSVRSEGSVWKMEIEVYSKSHPVLGQPSMDTSHTSIPRQKNRRMQSWRFLEPSETIHIRQQAVRVAIESLPDSAHLYGKILLVLRDLFKLAKSKGKLNESIEIANIAVDVVPRDDLNHTWWINSLGYELSCRADHGGSEDLDRAITLTEGMLAITPHGDTRAISLLGNLGGYLCQRFENTGATEDLTRGVEKTIEAVRVTGAEHSDILPLLGILASRLRTLHARTGSLDHLNRAIEGAELAAKDIPGDHSNSPQIFTTLGTLLLTRFEYQNSTRDIDSAVGFTSVAVLSVSPSHDSYAELLANLGACFTGRFESGLERSSMGDFDQNIKSLLAKRLNCEGSMDDLDWAIKVSGTAVDFTPQDSPLRAALFHNLGNILRVRFQRSQLQDDSNRMLQCYKEGWNCRNAPPTVRIRLAHTAATFLASESKWDDASGYLDSAVELLPAASPRFLNYTDKQHMLLDWAGLASFSAAAALNAGKGAEHALERLELGRGVIASLLLETRSELTDLRQEYPELASEFETLRDELDSEPREIKQRYELEGRFKSAVTKIRSCHGFEGFLLPLAAAKIKAAASSGVIVVVNVNEYRCDAFLVTTHSVRSVALPQSIHSDFAGKVHISSNLLERLWEKVACPILNEIGFSEPIAEGQEKESPRIWWILTGPLSRLPLHAAGRHSTDSSESVLGRVISSYSTSIKTLIYARQKSGKKSSKSALLVSMPETPSGDGQTQGDLTFVEKEIQLLDDLLRPSVSTRRLRNPRKADVLRSVEASTVFHFAGHSVPHFDNPAKSSLLLDDWLENPLTVEDLTSLKLSGKSSWLAYLSACSTGENKIEHLQDEAIHLVSACQLAGFAHVVGSLWRIDDKCSAEAARIVYSTIIENRWTDDSVALGVHYAAKYLRDIVREEESSYRDGKKYLAGDEADELGKQACLHEDVDGSCRNRDIGGEPLYHSDPNRWAAYVHFGP